MGLGTEFKQWDWAQVMTALESPLPSVIGVWRKGEHREATSVCTTET